MPLKHLTILSVALLALAGCEPLSFTQSQKAPVISLEPAVSEAERQGDLPQAIVEYSALAENSPAPLAARYRLKAATIAQQLGDTLQAQALLNLVETDLLPPSQQTDTLLLDAALTLQFGDPLGALDKLRAINETSASMEQITEKLQIAIEAYAALQNPLDEALTRLRLEPFQTGQAITDNREALWQALMQLSPEQLEVFNPGAPPADDSGWFALAYLYKTYANRPEALAVALQDWQRLFPRHPADLGLLQRSQPVSVSLPEHIQTVAVLLPSSGPLASAAQAIRNGILAAHFSLAYTRSLIFLNVDTDPRTGQSNVLEQYEAALKQGADIILGPLERAALERLAEREVFPVPVIALNRLEMPRTTPGLYQIALSPEEDAQAVAHQMHKRTFQRVVVLAPMTDWADRIVSAFRDEWLGLGGEILAQHRYDEQENDFAELLRPMLDLPASEARNQAIRRALSTTTQFEPRRRQDIDAVFIVARPLKARQLATQLRFHRSSDLPLVLSSQAYSGQVDQQQDVDLEGVFLVDIPWVIPEVGGQDPIYQALTQANATHFHAQIRLHALGVDAYRLIGQLTHLGSATQLSIAGATGQLRLGPSGTIVRELLIGRFTSTQLQPVAPLAP